MTIPGAPSDRPLGQRELVVMLALLMSLQALAIDGMLPALDNIASELGAGDGNRRQLVVATYLLAGGIGTLIPGALADRFGRRPVLLSSIAAYSLLSLAIAFVNDFTTLLVLRVKRTKRDAARRALRALRDVGATCPGFVLNAAASGEQYDYRVYYATYGADTDTKAQPAS